MKRKILAIALSLALLTSLFVFATPVSAGDKFDFSFDPVSKTAGPA